MTRHIHVHIHDRRRVRDVGTMTVQEIKSAWRAFCSRQRIDIQTMNKGLRLIADDPEYWERTSMWDLVTRAQQS